jgi:hypothetical protein
MQSASSKAKAQFAAEEVAELRGSHQRRSFGRVHAREGIAVKPALREVEQNAYDYWMRLAAQPGSMASMSPEEHRREADRAYREASRDRAQAARTEGESALRRSYQFRKIRGVRTCES